MQNEVGFNTFDFSGDYWSDSKNNKTKREVLKDNTTNYCQKQNMKDIEYLGFGFVDKAILSNKELDIYAKAVYVYLCVYRNIKNNIAFPSMRKLCRELNICRNTATKAIKSLVELKIIERKFRAYWGYKYEIKRNKCMGYSKVPKAIMIDDRLSAQSKVIYALLCIFAGKDTFAYPKTYTICKLLGICKATYSLHIKLLINYKYITREQQRVDGKFASNFYTLEKFIDTNSIRRKGNIDLIKGICRKLQLDNAPIKYFVEKLEKNIKKFGTSHIHNIELYIKQMIKNYMKKHNIPIPEKDMTEAETLAFRKARMIYELENFDFLLKNRV